MDNIADESECFRVIFHELFHLELGQSAKRNYKLLKVLATYLANLVELIFGLQSRRAFVSMVTVTT